MTTEGRDGAHPAADRFADLRLLVLDNYDSFTYNLVQYLGELGCDPTVRTHDALDLDGVRALEPDGIVISPGPGTPTRERDFGVCGPVLTEASPDVPTLGVCLGLQGFVHRYGGTVERAPAVVHGKASTVHHDGQGVFEGLPDPLRAGRYHSLIAAPDLPDALVRSAWTDDGEVMGVRHATYPIEGVQFHPESILTDHGRGLLANFLEMCR